MQLLSPFNPLRIKPLDSMTGSLQLGCSRRVHTPQQSRCCLMRQHQLTVMPQHTGTLLPAALRRSTVSMRQYSLQVSRHRKQLFDAALNSV